MDNILRIPTTVVLKRGPIEPAIWDDANPRRATRRAASLARMHECEVTIDYRTGTITVEADVWYHEQAHIRALETFSR